VSRKGGKREESQGGDVKGVDRVKRSEISSSYFQLSGKADKEKEKSFEEKAAKVRVRPHRQPPEKKRLKKRGGGGVGKREEGAQKRGNPRRVGATNGGPGKAKLVKKKAPKGEA